MNNYKNIWQHKNTFAIGGLENVGFSPDSDLLIVLSSQGEGIFDCKEGLKIARESNNGDWWNRFDEITNSIVGFNVLENINIKTHGLYGEDNLPKITEDFWILEKTSPMPDDKPFEKYLVQKIYLISPNKKKRIFITKDGPCELRAYGFSDTGKTMIVASSCEIVIYAKSENIPVRNIWNLFRNVFNKN